MAPPKHPWFRMYVEALTDRKLRRLTPAQRWLWVAVLATARSSPEPGVLLIADGIPSTVEDLAELAGVKLSEVRQGITRMLDLGLLEGTDPWRVPKWGQRQFESDTSTPRTRKHRSGNGDETAMERSGIGPEAEAEAETETEPSTSSSSSTLSHQGRRRLLEEASELIGTRASQRPGVTNPAACARAVARGVITDRHQDAYAWLQHHPTATPEALAAHLEPEPAAPSLPPSHVEITPAMDLDHHPAPKLDADVIDLGRAHLAQLRPHTPEDAA